MNLRFDLLFGRGRETPLPTQLDSTEFRACHPPTSAVRDCFHPHRQVLGRVDRRTGNGGETEQGQAGANVRNQEHHFKVMVKDAVPGLENPNQVSVKFATLPAPGEMLPDQRSQAPVMSAMSPVTLAIAAGVIAVLALLVAFGNRLRVRLQGKQAPDDRIWKG